MSFINFLTDSQKDSVSTWKYSCEDNSITTRLLTSYWNAVVTLVPSYVAPNVLSASGLLMVIYAYNLAYLYFDSAPRLVSLACALLIITYQTLDAIDGKHARATGNESPLGELFDHACDSVGTIFILLTLCKVFSINSAYQLFYILQAGQMLFLLEHLKALEKRVVIFSKYLGPGELVAAVIAILLARACGIQLLPSTFISSSWFLTLTQVLYYAVYLYGLYKCWTLKNHYGSQVGVFLCLFMRHITAMLIFFDLASEMNLAGVIAHSLVLSVVSCDLIVSKMASRELHPAIVVGSMLTTFKYASVNFVIFTLCALYYIKIFWEITQALNLSLLTPNRNVFCSGVFDMFHYGHMESLQKFLVYGNRLIVGIHNDECVAGYKRLPNMSHEQRCRAMRQCRSVSAVVPDCPLTVTKEFLEEHQIHVVVCSDEYDSPDDVWYRVPREMGILQVTPRTAGISTSALMKHVTYRFIEDKLQEDEASAVIAKLEEAQNKKKK